MAKRPSISGRGADIFLGAPAERVESAENHTSMPAQQRSGGLYPKATYYLPPDLQERLEDAWMQRRKSNRKLTKSDMVRQALEEYLRRAGQGA
jgi:hypothetical protein